MDGVDAALIDIEDNAFSLAATRAHPFPPTLRNDLARLVTARYPSASLAWRLDERTGELFAEAALALLGDAGKSSGEIRAIGSHGQTIAHHPRGPHPHTIQIGNPNIIAERTRITTVADFRRRDLAAGGEGAPLACGFHLAALSLPDAERSVVNVGGIANISVLPAQGDVTGFDSGPGNTLMDLWTKRHLGAGMDRDGAWAGQGRTDETLLARLCSDPYFSKPPPKSTGREYFNMQWLERHLRDEARVLAPEDVQSTLCELSAATVARGIEKFATASNEILVCGGGARNPSLMAALRRRLGPRTVETTNAAGIDPDWVEAAAFGWLARQTLHGLPGNLPSVTGARHPAVLGAIHPA